MVATVTYYIALILMCSGGQLRDRTYYFSTKDSMKRIYSSVKKTNTVLRDEEICVVKDRWHGEVKQSPIGPRWLGYLD